MPIDNIDGNFISDRELLSVNSFLREYAGMGSNSFFFISSLSNPKYHMPSYAEKRIDIKKI